MYVTDNSLVRQVQHIVLSHIRQNLLILMNSNCQHAATKIRIIPMMQVIKSNKIQTLLRNLYFLFVNSIF